MGRMYGIVATLLSLIVAAGCNQPVKGEMVNAGVVVDNNFQLDGWDGSEEVVPLDQVPAKVLEAARAAVDGIEFSRAERELEGKTIVYDLLGTAGGTMYEVEVTLSGKVLEVENEDEDDDDDDDDDDGDEDEDEDHDDDEHEDEDEDD